MILNDIRECLNICKEEVTTGRTRVLYYYNFLFIIQKKIIILFTRNIHLHTHTNFINENMMRYIDDMNSTYPY